MISLTTAKLLLLIGLCLGPVSHSGNHTIQITGKNYYGLWTQNATGWTLVEKTSASGDWAANGDAISTEDLQHIGPPNNPFVRAIVTHDWKHDSLLRFEQDVVQKQGTAAFLIMNAGQPNQQVFTVLTLENGKPL